MRFVKASLGQRTGSVGAALLLTAALLSGCKATGEDLRIADLAELIENPPTLAQLGLGDASASDETVGGTEAADDRS